ncbi:aspartic proteinase PCS1-like [Rhodamnia argentea]|uniref:Aspartic proteinase PCS1-like n=1 Tax=Rhodamnia argentea TaxID=178133 RepID=A0ABM3HFL3_9MYRT|nr:aspartic proteinase PCS1-like [Rhodamnia argentea]
MPTKTRPHSLPPLKNLPENLLQILSMAVLGSRHHRLRLTFLFFAAVFNCNGALSPSPPTPNRQLLFLLPLKTQNIPSLSSSLPRARASAEGRLPFRHNITLTVSVSVGFPPQPATMVLDTGSELSWLRCSSPKVQQPVFHPLASKSYSPVPCSSPTCAAQTRDLPVPASCDPSKLCHVIVSYADASSAEGTLASDALLIGPSARPGFLFGCMDSGQSSSPDEDARTTGLMGMNRGSLSLVTQMGLGKFSYCISGLDSSGVLLFGDAGFDWVGPLNYTPLVQISTPLPYFDRVAYTIQMDGIKVSGKVLPLPKSVFEPDHTGAGQTMVDSGTQFTFLLGPVYAALKNEFSRQTRGSARVLNDPNFVFQGAMDLCYLVPSARPELPELPEVRLVFRGAEMSVPGRRLLYRVPGEWRGSDWVYCFTFGNSDLLGVEAFVIGHHHQQDMWMEFDLERSRVGFAEVRCDLASQRLGLG